MRCRSWLFLRVNFFLFLVLVLEEQDDIVVIEGANGNGKSGHFLDLFFFISCQYSQAVWLRILGHSDSCSDPDSYVLRGNLVGMEADLNDNITLLCTFVPVNRSSNGRQNPLQDPRRSVLSLTIAFTRPYPTRLLLQPKTLRPSAKLAPAPPVTAPQS